MNRSRVMFNVTLDVFVCICDVVSDSNEIVETGVAQSQQYIVNGLVCETDHEHFLFHFR